MPYQLSRVHRSATNGICGAFTHIDDWQLTNRVPGVIVQKVTRRLEVGQYNGGLFLVLTLAQAQQAFDPRNTTLCLDTMTYWELFNVPARGDIRGDQFQSNWFARRRMASPSPSPKAATPSQERPAFMQQALPLPTSDSGAQSPWEMGCRARPPILRSI